MRRFSVSDRMQARRRRGRRLGGVRGQRTPWVKCWAPSPPFPLRLASPRLASSGQFALALVLGQARLVSACYSVRGLKCRCYLGALVLSSSCQLPPPPSQMPEEIVVVVAVAVAVAAVSTRVIDGETGGCFARGFRSALGLPPSNLPPCGCGGARGTASPNPSGLILTHGKRHTARTPIRRPQVAQVAQVAQVVPDLLQATPCGVPLVFVCFYRAAIAAHQLKVSARRSQCALSQET